MKSAPHGRLPRTPGTLFRDLLRGKESAHRFCTTGNPITSFFLGACPLRGWFPLFFPLHLTRPPAFQPSPPDAPLVGRSPPAPGDVARSTGLTCGRFGGLLWRPSQKKTGKKGLESPFFIRQCCSGLGCRFAAARRAVIRPRLPSGATRRGHRQLPKTRGACPQRLAARTGP